MKTMVFINSKLFVEDPKTSGEKFIEDKNHYNLVKCGHYFELLSKIGYGFIGQALLYKDKLKNVKFSIPVFVSKQTNKEYIGRFDLFNSYPMFLDFPFFKERDLFRFSKFNSSVFYGVEKRFFKNLMKISKGNSDFINELVPK